MEPCAKQTFPSKRAATKQARALKRIKGWNLHCYCCDRCGEYHLTHMAPEVYLWWKLAG
jgi:hypothetical protein